MTLRSLNSCGGFGVPRLRLTYGFEMQQASVVVYIEVELSDIQSRKVDPEIELLDGIYGGSRKEVAKTAPGRQQSSSTMLVWPYIIVVASAENSLLVS